MSAYDRIKRFYKSYTGLPATRGELAAELDIPWSTVNRNIEKLCREGFLVPLRQAGGSFVAYARA